MTDDQPLERLEIEDLETLKVLADPLRVQILEHLVLRPMTVKEVASRLGLTPGRLYYHVNLLEEHGLIRVVEQRMVSNLVEKVYRAAAFRYEVAESLLNFDTEVGKENINTMLLSVLDTTREELARSLQARSYALEMGAPQRPRQATINRRVFRIPEEDAVALQRRLAAVLDDFEAASVDETWDEAEAHTYAMTVAFYPSFDYPDAEVAAEGTETAPNSAVEED